MYRIHTKCFASILALAATMPVNVQAQVSTQDEDPYRRYILTAPEFRPVRQDPAFLIGRWNTWIYMPWRYQWTIGTNEAGGRFCRDFGFNGGFTDHGEGPLDWLAQLEPPLLQRPYRRQGGPASPRVGEQVKLPGRPAQPARDPSRDRRPAAHRRETEAPAPRPGCGPRRPAAQEPDARRLRPR